MKKISCFLIMLGIAMAVYPLVERGYTWYWQWRLLSSYEEEKDERIHEETINEYQSIQTLLEMEAKQVQSTQTQMTETSKTSKTSKTSVTPKETENSPINIAGDNKKTKQQSKSVGIIKIDKINLLLPVLEGATEKNLKIGAAHVKGTAPLGEVGNAVLAGHRSHTRGRFFNRLDEIEVGDVIIIEKGEEVHEYQVYKIHVVEPHDTSVLMGASQGEILTLITCTPLYKATHRLIIHSLLINKP